MPTPNAASLRTRARPSSARATPRGRDCRSLGMLAALACAGMGRWVPGCEGTGGNPASWGGGQSSPRLTGIIIPGFASSRLLAWALLDCPFTPLDFNPLDPVWLDSQKVVGAPSCWLKCIMLDPRNQTDHPECRSRADHGLTAITELDPGVITGPLSSVWREWVNWCVEFGIDADAVVAVPYDWRLYPNMLEERDLYFHKLKLTFEASLKLRGPALVFAHSLGNNVFRYFLHWLRHEIAPREYQAWLDTHIHSYYAVAAPLLGAPEALRGLMTGLTFGLPISEGTAKQMGNSFAASMWMYPFSPYCHAPAPSWCSTNSNPAAGAKQHYQCRESSLNASGWPVPVMSLAGVRRRPPTRLQQSHPPAEPLERCTPEEDDEEDHLYSAEHIANGSFLRDIAEMDPDAHVFNDKLGQWYLDDPILNPLTPWDRPPLKNVFCVYGIDLKTEVGFAYSPSGEAYPNNWDLDDTFYETEGGELRSDSGLPVYGNKFPASGDVTVPYFSLSWCKTWLGPRVNVTRAPMHAHEADDVQKAVNMEHRASASPVAQDHSAAHLYPSAFGRVPGDKYITYYEDSEGPNGRKTAVWELDKVDHRNIVRSHVLLREVWLQVLHSAHPHASSPFVSKDYREPMRDEDCYWDYPRARCAMGHRCEYRYAFGDIHLGQSCRLKKTSETDYFERYL